MKRYLLGLLFLALPVRALEYNGPLACYDYGRYPSYEQASDRNFLVLHTLFFAAQIGSLALLKCKHRLFGDRKLDHSLIAFGPALSMLSIASFIRVLDTCSYSDTTNGLALANNGLTVLHAANLAYYEYFSKKGAFTVKKEAEHEPFTTSICGICRQFPKDPIKPCDQVDHFFCKDCFSLCIKNKHQNDEDPQFTCELCRLPVNPENVSITSTYELKTATPKQVVTRLLTSCYGVVIIGLFMLNLYNTMACD